MSEFPIVIGESGEISFAYRHEDPLVVREKIKSLTETMLRLPKEERVELKVESTVCDGMYMRKLYIPKGILLVGKIHKKKCMNIVAAGEISILTESGSSRVKAGFTIVSPAGLQKVGIAHEDTIFINVFRTDETDIEKIESEIACESYDDLVGIDWSGRELMVQEVICQ